MEKNKNEQIKPPRIKAGSKIPTVEEPVILPSPQDGEGDPELENAMLTLYQNIESLLPDAAKKIIQFIGSRKGEGISTVVRKFGRTVAGTLGKPVLILDLGRSAPGVDQSFTETGPGRGWGGVLPGGNDGPDKGAPGSGDIDEVLYRGKASGALYVIQIPMNGASVHQGFNSPEMKSYLFELKERFDLILVDSPAVTVSPAGAAFCRNTDGVVLVLEAETTRWPVAEHAKEMIGKNGGRLLGIVFNKRRYHIPRFIYQRL